MVWAFIHGFGCCCLTVIDMICTAIDIRNANLALQLDYNM